MYQIKDTKQGEQTGQLKGMVLQASECGKMGRGDTSWKKKLFPTSQFYLVLHHTPVIL